MKRLILVFGVMLAGTYAFGQRGVERDPTYSIHNYKHPNKAAYAREHNFDHLTPLDIVSVQQNANYKQPFNNGVVSGKAVVGSGKIDQSRKSYKHPHEL